ncbi:MAG: LacI family transcriptional regulator [Tannerellaceae bacterium]|nr:LacI family transcriptional regulator [Tannerellaceae bacterium]
MKRTSIKDIAQAAGVSTATVSLVLTGKGKDGRVSKEMSEKINHIAREMNYQPNRLARSLQSGRTQTIGLLVADIVNPFFGSLAYHVQEEMGKAGYAVMIMNTDESPEQMKQMVDLLKCRQVDGFIIVPAEGGEECVRQLKDENIPVVLMDRYYPSVSTSSVLINNYDASYQATSYLIRNGCQNVALLIYENNQPHMAERKAGYMDALQDAGLFNETLIREVRYKNMQANIRDAVASILYRKEKTDGILFATNTIAMHGLKQLYKLNVSFPGDIRVVCFDKNELYDFLPAPIPHIQQPIPDIARLASRLLLEQIHDKTDLHTFGVHRLPASLQV